MELSYAALTFRNKCNEIIALQAKIESLRDDCHQMWYDELTSEECDVLYHIAGEAEI